MPRPSFTEVGPAVTDKEIDAAEAELGVTIPEPYRRFLLQTNGGRPVPECVGGHPIHTLYGIRQDVNYSLVLASRLGWEEYEPSLSTEFLPIGHTAFGDTIGLHLRTGKVYWQDHEEDEMNLMFDDFDTFLASFLPLEVALRIPPE